MYKLTELRKNSRKTQAEVARYLKITRSAYSCYELNKREIPISTLFLLSDYYGVSIDYLLGRDKSNTVLNKDEAEVLRLYRQLDGRGKAAARVIINFEYEQQSNIESEVTKATG